MTYPSEYRLWQDELSGRGRRWPWRRFALVALVLFTAGVLGLLSRCVL